MYLNPVRTLYTGTPKESQISFISGNDCLNDVFVALKLAQFFPAGKDVVGKHRGSLVTVEKGHIAVIVAYCDSHTVCIRVGCHHNVGIFLLCNLYCHCKGSVLFRIGRSHRGEISVADILLGNVEHVVESEAGQALGYQTHAAAVKRCIYELEILVSCAGLGTESQGQDVLQVLLVNFLTHYVQFSAAEAALELYH